MYKLGLEEDTPTVTPSLKFLSQEETIYSYLPIVNKGQWIKENEKWH
jgi:hypothetical protein